MKTTTLKDVYTYTRELCNSTARINLISIAVITLIMYLPFLLVFNRDLFFFLTHIKGVEDYISTHDYIRSLEGLRINSMNMTIPIFATVILFIAPSEYMKRDLQNRLLPVSAGVRLVAIVFVSMGIALVSGAVVVLLDHALVAYMRYCYLEDVLTFRESIGDLYHQLPNSALIATQYYYPLHLSAWLSTIFLTPFVNLLTLNMKMVFVRFGLIKGVLSLGVVVCIIVVAQAAIEPNSATVLAVDVSWITDLYSWVLTGCLVGTLFFAFKEREG